MSSAACKILLLDEEVLLRKILFAVVTLMALLLAAEVGVTMLGQRGLAAALRSEYGLPDNLEARLNSFPLLVSLARNHLAELQLKWGGDLPVRLAGEDLMVPYAGSASLYDVEIDMASLLRGRLELRSISRAETLLTIGGAGIAVLGGSGGSIRIEEGRIYREREGEKIRCRVKVLDENTLALEEVGGYTAGSGSASGSKPYMETYEIEGLPMEGRLRKASVSGESLVIEISIPKWEGFL